MSERGLGKGLSALISERPQTRAAAVPASASAENAGQEVVHQLPVAALVAGKYQPRYNFDEEELRDLADSIRANGIVQPVLARKTEDGRFEIVAGERRWRAAQLIGLEKIPVIVKPLSDKKSLEIGLIENIQRQNLQALEEAEGYKRLIEEFHYTQEDLAQVIGRNRATISNAIRLLSLPAPVKELLNQRKLSAGHARALLGANDPAAVAETVVKRALNVRQTEQLIRKLAKENGPRSVSSRDKSAKDPEISRLEQEIGRAIGLSIEIVNKGQSGYVTVAYHSLAELDDILKRLESKPVNRSVKESMAAA